MSPVHLPCFLRGWGSGIGRSMPKHYMRLKKPRSPAARSCFGLLVPTPLCPRLKLNIQDSYQAAAKLTKQKPAGKPFLLLPTGWLSPFPSVQSSSQTGELFTVDSNPKIWGMQHQLRSGLALAAFVSWGGCFPASFLQTEVRSPKGSRNFCSKPLPFSRCLGSFNPAP